MPSCRSLFVTLAIVAMYGRWLDQLPAGAVQPASAAPVRFWGAR